MEPRDQTKEEERSAYNTATDCWDGEDPAPPTPAPPGETGLQPPQRKATAEIQEGQVQVPMIRGGKAKKKKTFLAFT